LVRSHDLQFECLCHRLHAQITQHRRRIDERLKTHGLAVANAPNVDRRHAKTQPVAIHPAVRMSDYHYRIARIKDVIGLEYRSYRFLDLAKKLAGSLRSAVMPTPR